MQASDVAHNLMRWRHSFFPERESEEVEHARQEQGGTRAAASGI